MEMSGLFSMNLIIAVRKQFHLVKESLYITQ